MNAEDCQRMLARYEVRARQFDVVAAERQRRSGGSGSIPEPLPHLPATSIAAGALTRRERDVLIFISRGSSNAEISHALLIGEETVKTHVKKVLAKLDARNRAHAVAIGVQRGLVDLEPAQAA